MSPTSRAIIHCHLFRDMHRKSDIKMSHSEGRLRSSPTRERELERKRREWMIEQERAREHERRKQKMIREYEERRARELALKSHSRRSSNSSHSKNGKHIRSRTHSRSRSHSPSSSCTKSSKIDCRVIKNLVMSEKLDASSSNSKLFKGPDGTQIPVSDLKKIKVDIRRNIEAAEKTKELQRNIVDPEDVVLKRREGEGAKPIFEREELKQSEKTSNIEIEEHRTVVTINGTSSSRRTVSLSPERHHRNRSPRRDSRHVTSSRSLGERVNYHRNPEYSNSEKSRNVNDRERSRDRYNTREYRPPGESTREHKRRRSVSAEPSDRRRSRRELSAYEPERYDDRNRRYEDDNMRRRPIELRPHYLQPVPVPFYYENYARPIMVDPMMQIRGPIGMGRGRMPPMMGIIRPPYPPRFIPPVMFRSRGPPNPRY